METLLFATSVFKRGLEIRHATNQVGNIVSCVSNTDLPPAERCTRGATYAVDSHVSGGIIADLEIEVSDVDGLLRRNRCAQTWRRLRHLHVPLHVRAKVGTDHALSVVPCVGAKKA